MKTVLIVGATGRQGTAIVTYLANAGIYKVLAFTRSTTSDDAKNLAALPNVELVASNASSGYDIPAFVSAASRSDAVVVNTDGFAIGEQAETYWGIRLFQLAAGAGVKQFIYSGLDSLGKLSEYDPKYYVGHYEGKARIQEWMHAQTDSAMKWTIIRSGPYTQLFELVMAPSKTSDGTFLFQLPLGDGAVPFVHLEDFGGYVHWALSHPEQSANFDFGIAIAHVSGNEIAEAFTAYTKQPAKFIDTPIEEWHNKVWKGLPKHGNEKIGFKHVHESALTMTYRENFTNWWNLYKASAGNKGLIKRDYEFLDQIYPERVSSLKEALERMKFTGENAVIVKQ